MCALEAPFEAPIEELRRRIDELEGFPPGSGRRKELKQLRSDLEKTTEEVYSRLTRWEKDPGCSPLRATLHPRVCGLSDVGLGRDPR